MIKKLFFVISLACLAGCTPATPQYTPIDWNSSYPETPARPNPLPKPQPEPAHPQTDPVTARLLELHNYQRGLKGRPPLKLDQNLQKYAGDHANWMATHNNLKHSDINNILKMRIFTFAGENIAWNQQDADEVTDAWMHSTGHRDNILNRNFNNVGFGLSYNSRQQPYWCTCFGD